MRIQAEEFGQDAIAAMSQLDRFQAGEQATLLFVEQAVEKQDSRFEFFGRYLKSGSIGYQRNRLGGFRYHSSPHGVGLGVSQGRPEVWLVERAGVISTLPHMSGSGMAGVEIRGVAAVCMLELLLAHIGSN